MNRILQEFKIILEKFYSWKYKKIWFRVSEKCDENLRKSEIRLSAIQEKSQHIGIKSILKENIEVFLRKIQK